MNIFVLDADPVIAARYHCDKHVVKMVLETAQMLSTVAGRGYKPSFQNHPCTVWAGETTGNYQWLYDLGMALGREFQHRYRKRHKSSFVIAELWPPPPHLPEGPTTPRPLAMPEKYHQECAVAAYRAYYIGEKWRMLSYKNREWPEWLA